MTIKNHSTKKQETGLQRQNLNKVSYIGVDAFETCLKLFKENV